MARGPNPEVHLFWSILFTEIQPSSCLHNWLQLSQYNGRAKHLQEEKTVGAHRTNVYYLVFHRTDSQFQFKLQGMTQSRSMPSVGCHQENLIMWFSLHWHLPEFSTLQSVWDWWSIHALWNSLITCAITKNSDSQPPLCQGLPDDIMKAMDFPQK